MDNIILHSTSLKDFQALIGEVMEEKLRQFNSQQPKPADSEYITRNQVCDKVKISLATLYSYTKDGTLKSYRIGGRVLYRLEEVEQSIKAVKTFKFKHGRGL